MKREETYRGIAIICGAFLAIGLFVHINNHYLKSLFDLFYDAVALTMSIFTYLWLKKDTVLLGLILFVISFNIKLLYSPLLPTIDTTVLSSNLRWTGYGLGVIGIVFALIGISKIFEIKLFPESLKLDIIPTLLTIILFTGLVQVILRLV